MHHLYSEARRNRLIANSTVTAVNTPYLNQVRPFLGYSAITTKADLFSSNYNSLQTSMRKQFGKAALLH